MYEIGSSIIASVKNNVDKILGKDAELVYIKSLGFISMLHIPRPICISDIYISELGAAMCDRWPSAAAVIYYIDDIKNTVNISFRSSKTGPDVEETARQFGVEHMDITNCYVGLGKFLKLIKEKV
jgi:hypothetical protein